MIIEPGQQMKRLAPTLVGRLAGTWFNHQAFDQAIDAAIREAKHAKLYTSCPRCHCRGCDGCRKSGWLPKHVYNQLPADVRAEHTADFTSKASRKLQPAGM